jgi:hypothetical protein
MRKNAALAAGLALALASTPAWAQGTSSEGRGYGGPLNVGPNFKQGGQYTPPVYGPKTSKQRTTPKRNISKSKAPAAKEAHTEKGSSEKESSTVSSGSVPSSGVGAEGSPKADTEPSATAEAPATPTTCKRFDATSGQTITVPCE